MSDFMNDPLWYKDAVIYQLHVRAFFDGNNDGIGDFPGLIQKLETNKAMDKDAEAELVSAIEAFKKTFA